ncbi:MAG: DUF305 domain-containing protein [Patescibacteria group bacterium]
MTTQGGAKMKNDKNLYAIGGVILGAVLVWVLFSSAVLTNNVGMMQMMGLRTAGSANSDSLDAHFIEQMIPHHEDAITMAQIAETKAKTSEVKQLAKNIITSQGAEITQMKSWYKDWFGRDLPTGKNVMNQHGMMGGSQSMHMGMMGNETDSIRLENAADFDKAFVEDMIPHHQMAVMMASMLKDGSSRPEMRKLADDIIAAQTSEIDQMRSWLTQWSK